VLTVINWFSFRRSRGQLHDWVARQMTDKPTLVAVVGDKYTSESSLRPFTPLGERFGDRLHVLLAAEWPGHDRQSDGRQMFERLGVADSVIDALVRDAGDSRLGLLFKQKRPFALVELFFVERGQFPGEPDGKELELRALETELFEGLEKCLLPSTPPDPGLARPLRPGEHDFGANGICRKCNDGRASLRACPGPKRDEGPNRDRFELIELD
jgi:hypothetical protein